tara:strand:+ start:86 stop:301 length:216 start_codon:yes stop_codon:yes gene_type:complete
MVEAIGWLTIACIVMVIVKAIVKGKITFPEDWWPRVIKDREQRVWPSEESPDDIKNKRLWNDRAENTEEKD